MNEHNYKYFVDRNQVDTYLRNRFRSVSISSGIEVAIAISFFSFILYKQQAPPIFWSFLISIPIVVISFLIGLKRWGDKFRDQADTSFIITTDGLVQITHQHPEKNFKFSDIVIVKKKKFGTIIVRGNWLTKINYYRFGATTSYLFENPESIFIPNITKNYSELIEAIERGVKNYR